MRVSFDLDEVLFVFPETHKTEPELKFPLNKMYKERLRLGTPKLINTLQELGYEVWVYTSSFRSEAYIKKLFKHYVSSSISIIYTFNYTLFCQIYLFMIYLSYLYYLPCLYYLPYLL